MQIINYLKIELMESETRIFLIAILVLLAAILIFLGFLYFLLKKYFTRTDWSLVYPELAGMYYGDDDSFSEPRSQKLDRMLEKPPVATDKNLKKFEKDLLAQQSGESVVCSAYSPNVVEIGEEFIIAAFISFPSQKEEVEKEAKLIDDELVKRAEKFLNLKAKHGDSISFVLQVENCEIDDYSQNIVWQGEITSVEFGVRVLSGFKGKKIMAKLNIGISGIPAGNIKFRIKVQEDVVFETTDAPVKTTTYKKAFVSYASSDRDEVLRRTQMLSATGITFFQDIMQLKPGQLWESSLYREIDKCDVFFLFWSSSAKNSKWVKKEYEYAQGLQAGGKVIEIIPVPIEGPPTPEPPSELSHLHFNDGFLYFIQN